MEKIYRKYTIIGVQFVKELLSLQNLIFSFKIKQDINTLENNNIVGKVVEIKGFENFVPDFFIFLSDYEEYFAKNEGLSKVIDFFFVDIPKLGFSLVKFTNSVDAFLHGPTLYGTIYDGLTALESVITGIGFLSDMISIGNDFFTETGDSGLSSLLTKIQNIIRLKKNDVPVVLLLSDSIQIFTGSIYISSL